MPARPTSATARETVPTPWLSRRKCAVLTRRSSFCVSATSLRISSASVFRLSDSELAMRWMRSTCSVSAGKSLLWRMRRNRKSSVPWPLPVSGRASSTGASHCINASRRLAAVS